MSKSENSLPKNNDKIKKMAFKYRKFKAKQADAKPMNKTQIIGQSILKKCKQIWCNMVPYSIRDYQSQYELFSHLWKEEIGKDCMNQIISPSTLEQNLQHYQIGQPIVVSLLYSAASMPKIVTFITRISTEETKKQFIFCPLNIESRQYQQQFEPKIGYFDESLVVFWRGLFNEIIMLNRFKTYEIIGLFKTVQEEINSRVAYEKQIRQLAFPDQTPSMTNSDIVLQN